MNYKDHILVLPKFVPDEFCDDVVTIMNEADELGAKVDKVIHRRDIQYRGYGLLSEYAQKENNKDVLKLIYFFQRELQKGLETYAECDPYIKDTFQKGTWFFDSFKWQKTPKGGGFHIWHCENTVIWQRQLVWNLYLNDVEEGGETEFLAQNRRIKAEKGTMVIFPANWTHMHRGNPPINTEKYIGTGWYTYHISEEQWTGIKYEGLHIHG